MKVWIVTNGQYSDKGNVAVFSDEQTAKNFRDKFYSKEGDIEEFELDSIAPGQLAAWVIELNLTGELIRAYCEGLHHCCGNPPYKQTNAGKKTSYFSGDYFEVKCWAEDENHAVKIASEKWAEWVAATQPMIARAQSMIESGDSGLKKIGLAILADVQ